VITIPNLTARRDAITEFGGPPALIGAGGGKLVDEDDFGKLWSVPWSEPDTSDAWARYVEVVNSTVKREQRESGEWVDVLDENGEPVFDHYFLRVPPNTRSAREAVAWTGHFEPWRVRGLRDERFAITRFDGFAAQS
jgi:hypothetical protein